MKINISKLNESKFSKKVVFSWPIWNCDVSEFNWEYGDRESCYLIDGEVVVSSDFESVTICSGDFVVFPKGLKCRWKVIKPIKKHYIFG